MTAKKKTRELTAKLVKPLGDRIIVKPNDAETVTAGGIIIPDTAKEKPHIGQVVRAGRGTYENGVLIPMEVKVGDMIIYGKWAGTEIELDGEALLIMRESSDVLAII